MRSFSPSRGMTLIDVLVGIAIFLVIFLGLYGILSASVQVAGLARARAAATAIASSEMEYIRSLSYASIGTVGGIPAGVVPQTATTTEAGTVFSTRTLIEYVDDPKDGLGAADVNQITTDYKVAKVIVSYSVHGSARQVALISNFAPPSIETTTGGGTLQIKVVDATGAGLAGATVRFQNTSTSPAIDFSTISDTDGVLFLGGAPVSTEYQIAVSKSGYSSAQTYARDSNNQNPTPGYLTVAANHTTTSTFAIDRLATLTLRTFTPIAPALFTDTFSDGTKISSTAGTSVSGGSLVLSGTAGSYVLSGSATSIPVAPNYLASWVNASSTTSLPAGTSALVSITDGTGALLPDSVLPGNAAGFSGVVDLSAISTTTYPSLGMKAALSTGDPNFTPQVHDWALGYTAGPTPLPDVSVTLTGAKTIGSTSAGAPIYKTVVATTTDATGVRTLSLEWDSYGIAITGHSIVSSSPTTPYELLPSGSVDASLIVTP